MRGVTHPLKETIVKELKKGAASSVLSKKYGVAMSTITLWIKELPENSTPSKFQYKNKRISVMRKVNLTTAKIVDLMSDFVVCDISDEEWDQLQIDIRDQLVSLACFDGTEKEEIESLCNGCLFKEDKC